MKMSLDTSIIVEIERKNKKHFGRIPELSDKVLTPDVEDRIV